MSTELILPIVMRWTHIASAIILLGGSFFIRMILQPAVTAALSDVEKDKLHTPIARRWQGICHILILLFLISGFYNLSLSLPKHKGDTLYFVLFFAKFVMAFVVFYLVEALNSKLSWSQKIRNKMALWAGLTLVLGFLIVLISGTLKNLPIAL